MLLDIRTVQEYRSGHLPCAMLIPTGYPPLSPGEIFELKRSLEKVMQCIPKTERIEVYCKKGIRAGMAERILKEMGYRNVISLGGIETNLSLKKFLVI